MLAESDGVKIERIVSDGHASPEGFWYDQEQDEWVVLLAGSAALSIEMEAGIEQVGLMPGDHLLISAHQRHRVESTFRNRKDHLGCRIFLTTKYAARQSRTQISNIEQGMSNFEGLDFGELDHAEAQRR